MEIIAGLSVLFLVLVALGVATKTFALWRRNRGRPELLLGLYILCMTAIGYPLAIAMNQIPASESWLVHVVAEAVMNTGLICLILFTCLVFRPDARWARCLVALLVSWVVAVGAAYVVEVIGENPRSPEQMPGLIMLHALPVALAYLWTTIESLGYYRQLKLRLRLGLAEAVVTNRVLLWGLMTLAAAIAVVVSITEIALGSYLSAPVVLVCSILGLAHATCLFLAFHPPQWYRGWLQQTEPTAAG